MPTKNQVHALLIVLLNCFLINGAVAQTTGPETSAEFVIDFLDVHKGLASNFVTRTVSDNDNLKYFATEGGVSRYDGYGFKSYRPGVEFPGLANENIETLFKDRDNNIWIGTKSGGVSVLNIKTNQIKNCNDLIDSPDRNRLRVISINQDAKGHIWVGTWSKGVFVLDMKRQKQVAHYPFDQPVHKIIRDTHDNTWYIAGNTLYKYDPSESRLFNFPVGHNLFDLVIDPSRNRIWLVGSHQRQASLQYFDLNSQQVLEQSLNFKVTFIKSIALDRQGRLWLGSWGGGLYISNPAVTDFRRINTNPQPGGADNVNYAMILDIDIDRNGIAWLSTAYGGVLMLYPNKGFRHLMGSQRLPVQDRNVLSMFKNQQDVLLIGTMTDGLHRQTAGSKPERIAAVAPVRTNVFYEKGNVLFIGTGNGLYIVRDNNFPAAKRMFEEEKITAILLDSRQNLWIGTQQRGLKMTYFPDDPGLENCVVYAEEKKGAFALDNNRISQIREDGRGNIWLATYSGINLFDPAKQSFIPHQSLMTAKLPSVIINALYATDNRLYAGTPLGLADMTIQDKKLRLNGFYDVTRGLTTDFVCSIEPDNAGRLWLSTTTSITRFDPASKRFVNYDQKDGVMINSFHINSSYRDKSGNLYFGGTNGIVQFDPAKLADSFTRPLVVLTKLTVNNQALEVGQEINGEAILSRSIQYTDTIKLNYQQNHVSLSFAISDFFGTDDITYAYKLKGFRDQWVRIGKKNEINFTGLGSGKYDLLVRASRNNLDWSPAKKLHIVVGIPPWLRWYAFVFYFLLAAAILLLVRHLSVRQARLKANLQIVQVEKEKQHALHEGKVNFFTNISHEFRTPLTLIMGPIAEVLENQQLDDTIRQKIGVVETNARRMLTLINQLLDFRKSEDGLLKLKLTRVDFILFAREVFDSFQDTARQKRIAYEFVSELNDALIEVDQQQMEIVLCNLLSNAFKYTENGDTITFRVYQQSDQLAIDVIDSGIGLSEESSSLIFDRFYQVNNAQTAHLIGSGIGLAFSKSILDLHEGEISVKSEPGKGSCFTVLLPFLRPSAASPLAEPTDNVAENKVRESVDLVEADPSDQREVLLLVDDNADIRTYLSELLTPEYRILEAADGAEGLAIASRELPDLIISDVMMPVMDGIALCREIKQHIATSHIPVILLTARSSMAYEIDGLRTGADDYMTKPFNPTVVRTRVDNLLKNRKTIRQYYLNRVRFEPDLSETTDVDPDTEFIDKAIDLINENLQNEDFGIDTLMDQLFMSQSTLYRKIKSLTGLSLTGFIRSVRLKRAAQLIVQNEMKLSNVAYEVGFQDYKYFRKSFQQQFGCLPSKYRSNVLNTLTK